MADYQRRSIEHVLKKAVEESPVTIVSGPLGAGKTRLVKEVCPDHKYVDLKQLEHTTAEEVLEQGAARIIVDHVHCNSELLYRIHSLFQDEENPTESIVLCSDDSAFEAPAATRRLDGSVHLRLYNLAWPEIIGQPDATYQWLDTRSKEAPKVDNEAIKETLLLGTYPGTTMPLQIDVTIWHAAYIEKCTSSA